jgi:tRNA A-37 threonylcarbamoyl transferase component Bud32
MSACSSTAVRIGQILADRYSIQRLLGEGAVGSVFAAEDLELRRLVAIKVLKAESFGDRFALERFRREIHTTLRIECEYIVRTLGVDYLDNAAPFMVMEYFDARDVSKVIADSGPLPLEKAIGFTLQLCLALAHAHRVGIVHCDIKPANLLLVRQPNGRELVKILDFGISKMAADSSVTTSTTPTNSAVRLGTPMYMSPEQRTSGREVDERSDIWSLGITLFEMIAGVAPFDSSPQSIRGECEAPSSTPSLSRHRPGIPQGLDSVIAQCLQRMPELRFQNVADLASALAPYAAPGMVRLRSEVTQALGIPRFSAAQRSIGASPAVGLAAHEVGFDERLGPTAVAGPATIRIGLRHRGNLLWWLVGITSLGMVLSIALALVLHESERVSHATARVYSSMPVLPAWTDRASSWRERVPNLAGGVARCTTPPASSQWDKRVTADASRARPAVRSVLAEPSASAPVAPSPEAPIQAPPAPSLANPTLDVGY